MLNLDRVTDFLRTQGSSAEVRGVTDSGWFLDNVPYAPADCQDPQRCAPTSAVQMGHTLWNGQVPLACKAQYASQPWRCYFGHHLHRTTKETLGKQNSINKKKQKQKTKKQVQSLRDVGESSTQVVTYCMDVVPLFLGHGWTDIISEHLGLIKQPLENEQRSCQQ